ncbi:hypothetical protein MUP01_11650 [Candidatus Bathyarchaeota archaeon]|nr:hypothetical protein [Candidatus Bathyarchaeota archaeon]
MDNALRVNNANMARDIAIEAAKSMWRYTIPSSFYEVEYDKKGKCWMVAASYFEERLSFKIDAVTGNVSSFKVEKINEK